MALDVKPQPLNSKVEVRYGGYVMNMGYLDESELISDILDAQVCLDEAIDEGLFHLDDERVFQLVHPFDTVDEWTTYMRENRFGDPASDRDLVDRTSSVLSNIRGSIVIREPVVASRLTRLC